MAVFYYRARDKKGQLVEGSLTASSRLQGAQELRQQGLFPLEIRERAIFQNRPTLKFAITKKTQHLAVFAHQTGAMLEAGLPVLTCLELVKEQLSQEYGQALTAVQQDLKEGSSLAGALKKHPHVFPPLLTSMVEAGELGGILVEVLYWLAELYERETHLLEKVKSALLYPCLVLVLALLALVFLFIAVIPNFAHILENMGAEIPLITQLILTTARKLADGGFFLALVLGLLLGCTYYISKSPAGKGWRDKLLLEFPLIRDLTVKMLSARFCRMLSALLRSGVPILQAVTVVQKTLGNQRAQARLSLIVTDLQEGRSLGSSLAKTGLFPPQLVAVVVAGEESGQLPEFLFKLGQMYETECHRTLERVTVLLEPALMLCLGGFVSFVVIALLLPLFTLIGSL